MISLLRSLTVLALILAAPLAAQADVFLRVLAPGTTTGSSQQAIFLRVTTSTVALRVDARTNGMTAADLTGASVQFQLDGQPLGPVMTAAPYTWTWAPGATFKGVHTLQAKVLSGGPVGILYKSFSTMTFGAPDTGAQRLPALPPVSVAGTSLSASAESDAVGWFQYPGTPPSPPAIPLRGVLVPYPPVNPDALLSSGGWIVEPLTVPGHSYSQAAPRLCYEPSGQPWVCGHYQQAGNLSNQAAVNVTADLHTDGPRGVAVMSPYNTCVATPEKPGYGTCIDLAGRMTTVSTTGYVHTLVGPTQACDSCPVEFRGTFAGGLRFKAPNDLVYDFVDKTIVYVADTGNHRIARVDLKTTPPSITTLAGGTGAGYLDGPGLTAKFNEPYSVISHGPHPCPGRPEFTDCVHLYVADMLNGAARVLELHRQGEIPSVTTLIGGPSKLPPVDAAYANPAAYVQTCDPTTTATCTLNWPMVLRWDSNFNPIFAETTTGAIRRYNWATKKLELITIRPGGKRTEFPGWLWMGVDRRGEVGPVDRIFWSTSVTSSGDLFTISPDGTSVIQLDGSGNPQQGQGRYIGDFPGHYAWGIGIIWNELWTSGYGSLGMRKMRPYLATDHRTNLDVTYYNTGRTLMSRYEIIALYGPKGWNRLGLKTWDEMANMADPEFSTFLKTLVPSFTDDQAKRAMYYIRWNSQRAVDEPVLVGQAMGPGRPFGPVPPATYTITMTKSGTGQGTLSGAGSFPAGTVPPPLTATPVVGSQFVSWSLCSTASTPTLQLPALTGNVTCNAIFNLLPPPPASIDRFDVVPVSVPAGTSAILTWATSNATSVTLNGVAVAANGTLTVTPVVTTDYDLVANGITRRVTLTVVKPKPDVRIEIKKGLTYEVIEVTP